MTNLKDQPFALIGVNVAGNDSKKLKEVMDKEKVTWRTFADPGQAGVGAIAARWNLSGTPTLYVLDHQGVIRHKWVGAPGEQVIDAALDQLIKEARNADK
jgi:peroxiredoxin